MSKDKHFYKSWLGFVIAQAYFAIWLWIAPSSAFYKLLLLFLSADILILFGIVLFSKWSKQRPIRAGKAKVNASVFSAIALVLVTVFGLFHPFIRYNMLKSACLSGRTRAVDLLLLVGTRTEVAADFTPLMIASSAGNVDVVRMLIKHNANVSAITSEGMTALDYAKRWHNNEIEKLLLDTIAKKKTSSD
jgi:hypothetical protein